MFKGSIDTTLRLGALYLSQLISELALGWIEAEKHKFSSSGTQNIQPQKIWLLRSKEPNLIIREGCKLDLVVNVAQICLILFIKD